MENRSRIKAETFAELLRTAPIEIAPGRIFQQGLKAEPVIRKQRWQWWAKEVESFADMQESVNRAHQAGAYMVQPDFAHTSVDTRVLTKLGFRGVAEQVKEGTELRESAEICFYGMADYCLRLAEQDGVSEENAATLRHLAVGAPRTMYEAMQQISLYFYLHEYVAYERMRTLGRLDVVFWPFYQADRAKGMTYEQAKTLWIEFLNELWHMNVLYDLPFCIGGVDEKGEEVTNELSYLIVEAYDACHIHSPKIHVRVSHKTPEDFVKRVLACIRGGNSSFAFFNDEQVVPMMQDCGATVEDARDYAPIGCYEPAIFGKELGCTGNGWVNMAKAVEFAFTNGRDYSSGEQIGIKMGKIESYEDFYQAVKAQLAYMVEQCLDYIREAERHYMAAHPEPILSALMPPCAESGIDAYAGGAKYNNSSFTLGSIASAADAVYATKYLVFDQKMLTFEQLGDILRSNWEGQEELRQQMLNHPVKFGNNIEEVDAIAEDLAIYGASLINGKPNARGGIFKAANHTIDNCFKYGKKTMATPDGRLAGEPLSKNNSAVTGMDRKGITGLIQSAVRLRPNLFPDGAVLDFVIHPSAVAGEDGLDAFLSLIKVYFDKGGVVMHGNVFRAEDLKAAQIEPEKYANLQVRVCGWNVFFVNLSKEEQDAFIKQAEGAI